MAVELAHEIRSVAGVRVRPIPARLFSAASCLRRGISTEAPKSAEVQAGVKALIAFLSGPAAAPMIVAAGLQPAK